MEDNIKNLGKVCITPEGVWDVNKEYDRLSLVVTSDADTQRVLSYVSRKHVPKGNINIKDTEYWQLFTTELKLEDITIDENGNVKIGDVVIYQIPLGDALGEIVVDKIKTDLTNHIMTEIRSYMTNMVQTLINSFNDQISRLINNGITIRNNVSGGINARHSGNINVNVNGDSGSDDSEFIFTTDTLNINITSSSQWKQIYVNSEQNETPVEFSALHFPNWVEVLTIPSNPTVSSLVNIKFKENTDENSRGDNIILQQNGSNKTLTIHVIQQGTNSEPVNPDNPDNSYVFTANKNVINFAAAGGTDNVTIVSTNNGSNINYTVGTLPDWLTINNGVVTATANSRSSRNATITLTQSGSNNQLLINVSQASASVEPSDNFNFSCNQNSINFGAPSSYVDVTITSTKNGNNIGYTANSNDNWVTFSDGRITVNPNSSENSRNTTITLIQNESGRILTINITQAGAEPAVNTYIVDVNCTPITAHITINNRETRSWDFNEGENVVVEVSKEGYLTRTIYINHIDQDYYLMIDLVQDPGYTYVLHAQNTQINLNSDATSVQVPVTSTRDGAFIGYTARALNNASWITAINVPVDASTPLTITLAPNNTNAARSETIVLDQNESYNVTQIYITQAAPNSGEGGEGGNNGGSGGNEPDPGNNEPDPGNENNNPVYVFSTNDLSSSLGVDTNLSSTHNITSTKDGSSQAFSLTSKPNWANVSINGNIVTISVDKNRTTTANNGNVVLTQSESNDTITIQVTQAGLNTPPVGSEFVGMLIDNGVETEQSLNSRITLTSGDNYKVLSPRFKENGTLSQDTVTISYANFVSDAANTDKFNVTLSSTGLSIAPAGTLSESVTTSYEIVVTYNGYSAHYTFEIAYTA